ncbi:hypothetical protein [Flavobacterium sp. WC2430]|uniref:hypothetical protein n=1 Tax=Flavobacterium sp. WC2430 TaxID=3234137 RepID=UPI00346652A3
MITKDWLNFYTPMDIANEIISLIPQGYAPTTVVDICVGSGNFLKAASLRWNKINKIGVDICPTASIVEITENIYKLDALNLENLCQIDFGANKLILANPPFGKSPNISNIKISAEHQQLHLEAIRSKRIEALMLVSNLSILRKDELFAAILPENIFYSENLKKFNKMFFENFEILYLGDAKEYFKKSEVKTRIFIGKFIVKSKEEYSESKLNSNYKINIQVIRGIDNSKLLKTLNEDVILFDEVVHFNNNEGSIKLKRYIRKNSFSKLLKIEKNDILVSRVGRNSGKIHQVKYEYEGKYLSDYFYLLKNFKKIANGKQLTIMENALLQKKRGLTSRYICKKDILEQMNLIIEGTY